MKSISTLFGERQVKPKSQRTYLIQEIANSLKVPFKNVMNETWHLKGEQGCEVLRIILFESLKTGDNLNFRAKRCREMIDKSKGKGI